MRWLPAANGWGLCTACPSPSRTPSKWPACGQPAGPANWHTTCPAPTPPRSRGSRPPARWWSARPTLRAGGRHADLQRAVRHHQQPVGPGPGPRGIVRRIGGGGVLRLHGPRAGQRPRRLGARLPTHCCGVFGLKPSYGWCPSVATLTMSAVAPPTPTSTSSDPGPQRRRPRPAPGCPAGPEPERAMVAEGDKVVCRNVWRWSDRRPMCLWSSGVSSSGNSRATESPSGGPPSHRLADRTGRCCGGAGSKGSRGRSTSRSPVSGSSIWDPTWPSRPRRSSTPADGSPARPSCSRTCTWTR
jgi:hypothetical protein